MNNRAPKPALPDFPGVHYRPGTTDQRVLKEVLLDQCYAHRKIKFDVEPGESWLDLGANIGAFALYCEQNGAIAKCYEPDLSCFNLLVQNVPHFSCHYSAVTASRATKVPFYASTLPGNHTRQTELAAFGRPAGLFNNTWGGRLINDSYDGVKLDIEGSEGPLIDAWLLPRCNKLVMEYHSTRDLSVANFSRRVAVLRQHFQHVYYPPEFDTMVREGCETFTRTYGTRVKARPCYDRRIFCWNDR